MITRATLLFAAVLLAGACSNASADPDSDEATERAEYQLEDSSFEDVGDTSQCTQDCSGHDAGFEWARENGLTDPSECGGKSQSFIEGCEAYTETLQEAADDGDDSDDDY